MRNRVGSRGTTETQPKEEKESVDELEEEKIENAAEVVEENWTFAAAQNLQTQMTDHVWLRRERTNERSDRRASTSA